MSRSAISCVTYGHPAGLKLVDNTLSQTGVTINTYARAGDIDRGSFALEVPTEAEIERRARLSVG